MRVIYKKMAESGLAPKNDDEFYSALSDAWMRTDITGDQLISALGDYNPVHRGDLKDVVEPVVKAVSGDRYILRGYSYKTYGIVYSLPFVIGERRRRYRTTDVGLELLDHWAEHFPAYRRFHECYVLNKYRKEIRKECDAFRRGEVPKRIQDIQDRANMKKVAKILTGKKQRNEYEHEAVSLGFSVSKNEGETIKW